jgi:hypothetical protein
MDQIDPHARYLVERLERVEREVETHRGILAGLVTKTAVFDEVVGHINTTLINIQASISKTSSDLTWATRLVIGAVILGVIGFIVKGGLALVP